MAINRYSIAGRKGAKAFWIRFRTDAEFSRAMRDSWKRSKHPKEQIARAARMGGEALWRKYRSDETFRRSLDHKLKASRSRGGSISLRNLGELGFKRRLATGHLGVRARFRDSRGHRLRSSNEVEIAELLIRSRLDFEYEPRFAVGDHAFYPDFALHDGVSIIEVVGYAGDRYWRHTALKLRLLTLAYPNLRFAVITTYRDIVRRWIEGIERVTIFTPYQQAKIVHWCRGSRRGTLVPESRVV